MISYDTNGQHQSVPAQQRQLRDQGGQIHIPIHKKMQEFVDSSDDGRRNKGEMEELVGLARWQRGCLGASRATADKISLVTSN